MNIGKMIVQNEISSEITSTGTGIAAIGNNTTIAGIGVFKNTINGISTLRSLEAGSHITLTETSTGNILINYVP